MMNLWLNWKKGIRVKSKWNFYTVADSLTGHDANKTNNYIQKKKLELMELSYLNMIGIQRWVAI